MLALSDIELKRLIENQLEYNLRKSKIIEAMEEMMSNEITPYQINEMMRQLERINTHCTDNMKRLNAMMLELKGLVAMVRPQVKKTGWYGDELNAKPEFRESTKLIDIDLKCTE